MKKITFLAVIVILLTLLAGCSAPTKWSEDQRVEFIGMLDPYRDMVYINEFNDDEFVMFTTDVSNSLESAYPVYTQFIAMPALSDTVDMWVVTTIVDELSEDASNMRYLYPYHTLVKQGILPKGLDHESKVSFYRCFAQKVNTQFTSVNNFFYAVITNVLDPNVINKMQGECAAELFDFVVVEETEVL